MEIQQIGKVTHGATLARIEANTGQNYKAFSVFTMQELNRETGQYGLSIENQEVNVDIDKIDSNLIAKKGSIIVGLTSYKALVIEKKHEGKLIPSNFAIIEFDIEKIDPFYFAWYFNENSKTKKQLLVAMQGSIIRALSVQMLREFKIELPPINIQRNIGIVYKLTQRKAKLLFKKNALQQKLYNKLMENKIKECSKCQ